MRGKKIERNTLCSLIPQLYICIIFRTLHIFFMKQEEQAPTSYILKETKKSKAVQNSYETKKEIKKNKKDYTRASHDDIKDLINFCSQDN